MFASEAFKQRGKTIFKELDIKESQSDVVGTDEYQVLGNRRRMDNGYDPTRIIRFNMVITNKKHKKFFNDSDFLKNLFIQFELEEIEEIDLLDGRTSITLTTNDTFNFCG